MCGRYYIDTDDNCEQLRQMIEEINRTQANTEAHAQMKTGEIFPTDIVPVIGQTGPVLMKWGFAGFQRPLINARSETAHTKPMFRALLLERRCLIPASGYYEWKAPDTSGRRKQKYALYRAHEPIYMAGIWRMEQAAQVPAFVILTRDAAPGISDIHHRMPLILPSDACGAWLRKGADAGEIMQHYVSDLEYRAV